MPITFFDLAKAVAGMWKAGKAAHDWLTDQPLKADVRNFLASLEHRRVLYSEWKYESMPAVVHSLSDILNEVRKLRARHPENIELGVLLGDLIMDLQSHLDELHKFNATKASDMKNYRTLLSIRADLANALAILCGKTGVSPAGTDLERFIMDCALVRPRAR